MDDVDDDGGTAGRRRPAVGDSVTGDRADSPPLRDGIVDQLAVVASSGVRASDSASLASVGASYIAHTHTHHRHQAFIQNAVGEGCNGRRGDLGMEVPE